MGYSRVHANVREYDVFARKARVEPLWSGSFVPLTYGE